MTLPREKPGWHLDQMPELAHLAPLDVKEQWFQSV